MFKPHPPALVREAAEAEQLYFKCRCIDPATPKGFSKYHYQTLYKFLLRGETLSDEEWNLIHESALHTSMNLG